MAEAHKAALHDNLTSIEKLLKDKFSNKKERSTDSILVAIDCRLNDNENHAYYYDEKEEIEEEEIEEEEIEEEEEIDEEESDEGIAHLLPLLYDKWIYNMLHEIESRFLNDSNRIVELCAFEYLYDLTRRILKKFKSTGGSLVNLLPPMILRSHKEDYTSP
jgi:hypothetical protein